MFTKAAVVFLALGLGEFHMPMARASTRPPCDRDILKIEKLGSLRMYPYILLGKVVKKEEASVEGDAFDAGKVNGKRVIYDVVVDVLESFKGEVKQFTISAPQAPGAATCNGQLMAAAFNVEDKILFFFQRDPSVGTVNSICCLPYRWIKNSKTVDGLRAKVAELLRNDVKVK